MDYGSTWMKDWMEGGCEDRRDELHEKHFSPRKTDGFSRESSNDPDERDPFVVCNLLITTLINRKQTRLL